MLSWIYDVLGGVGYHHPLHPPMTHLPVGLVVAAFLFGAAARIFNRPRLSRTARHCILLALLAAPVTALLGLMDWQHRFGGEWLRPIQFKLYLAGILIVGLLFIWRFFRTRNQTSMGQLIAYALGFATVTALGFFGGELVYGPRGDGLASAGPQVQKGADLFAESCSMCHYTNSVKTKVGPGLKGLFKRGQLPVSQKPVTPEAIADQLKTPYKDMPAFPDLTKAQIASLVAYLKSL